MNRLQLAREICRAGRRLSERGLIAGSDGNIAARCGPDRLLVTPAGRDKGELEPGDLVEVDLAGRVVRGAAKPSTELGMHLAIFAQRPDVGAVVHAHPPTATGFAVAGKMVGDGSLAELVAQFGMVPVVPFGAPGTPELGERVRPFAREHDALLLANHGAVTLGATVEAACWRMESLEQGARILLVARLLGGARPLSPEEVARLMPPRRTS
ncbi:MAG TPA: class II aldolase/adducin family protein [Gemmatimonadales bacterium]|nr:class II aldolase/adducin family protein [Gemmatimonadales bacterium]